MICSVAIMHVFFLEQITTFGLVFVQVIRTSEVVHPKHIAVVHATGKHGIHCFAEMFLLYRLSIIIIKLRTTKQGLKKSFYPVSYRLPQNSYSSFLSEQTWTRFHVSEMT